MTAHSTMIDERSESGVLRGFAWAMTRDLRLAMRSRAELGVQLLFYVIVVTLFPLAVGADATLLRALGPGVLWVAALLASMLSLSAHFRDRLRGWKPGAARAFAASAAGADRR